MASLEGMAENCSFCGTPLDCGQIGQCDTCRAGSDEAPPNEPFVFGLYESASAPVPGSTAWPLDEELWAPHVDNDDLVTFLALVPLDTLVRGEEALLEYCSEAFDHQVEIRNAEFRAIGKASDNDDFSSQFVGDIPLQVTCTLQSVED